MNAITPGKILLEDYLVPMGISRKFLVRAIGFSLGFPQIAVDKSFRSNA